jgi:hypothetical protein
VRGVFDYVAIREAIAGLLTDLGFSTLPYDPVVPVAPYATVNLPDEVLYRRTYAGSSALTDVALTVSLYVGSAEEASANRALDLAISWNVEGAIPLQLEYAAKRLPDAPWNDLVVESATNRRTVDLENTNGVLLAIDLTLRITA